MEVILKLSHFETDDGNRCPGPGFRSQARKTLPKVQGKGTPIGNQLQQEPNSDVSTLLHGA